MPDRRLVQSLLIVLLASGCRDATAPFEATDRFDESGVLPRQLTFAPADDRSPSWDVREDGDHVLYATEGYPPFVEATGLLLDLPAAGGAASVLLPDLQFPGGPQDWLASPVRSPGGHDLAWVELWQVLTPNLCPQTVVMCVPESAAGGMGPRLVELRVHVGPEDGGVAATLSLPLDGVDEPVASGGGPARYPTRLHPFQALFQLESSAVFRPSWSPDGARLVLSDGLRMLLWRPGEGEPVPIPGTDDGVQPSWSPDGEWIAYTHLVRGDSLVLECLHSVPLGPVCVQDRVEWPITERLITRVRPDGSDRTVVGPGDDPAWLPHGRGLVFRRDGMLWTANADGSNARPIPGTEGGREPAVSPDGTAVVFARIDPATWTHDLILTSLGGGDP